MIRPKRGVAMAFKKVSQNAAGREGGGTATAYYVTWIAVGFFVITLAGRTVAGSIDDALGKSIRSYGEISVSQTAEPPAKP